MQFIVLVKNNLKKFKIKYNKTFIKGEYSYIHALLCLFWCVIRFGASPDDFYRYELYKKSNFERNKFITYKRSQKIIKKFNSIESSMVFSDKSLFNSFFSEYINRDWLDLRKANINEVNCFLLKHDKVILKPLNGGQGDGIFVVTKEDYNTINFNSYKDYLMEEVLVQNELMAILNPTSVNTIRVLTFKGHIIECALRIGGSEAVVDNLHSNGVCAHLDKNSGIIDGLCINNDMEQFLFHPISNIVLVGFQVPNWKKIIRTVQEAASKISDVSYIGWDVAVLQDGVAIIEGNHDPGHDVVQMIAQNGIYQEIRALM